jgi:NTP pyrophosphatase (non-canonical NTP hydrolase)
MNRWELKILKLVIDKFGIDYQLAIVQEECAELIQAISKLKRAGNSDHPGRTAKAAMNKLYEEVADVQIMLDQIKLMYPSKAYDTIRTEKLARLEKRMEKK